MPEYYLGNPSETDHAAETAYITKWGSDESGSSTPDFMDAAFTMGDDSGNDTHHGFFRIEMPERPFADKNMKITNVEAVWHSSNLNSPTTLTAYLINYSPSVLDYDNMSWENYRTGVTWETAGAKGDTDIDKSSDYGHGANGKIWVGTLSHNSFTYVPLTGLVDAKKLDWGTTVDIVFHYTANSDSGIDTYNVASPTYSTDVNDRPWIRITYENDLPTAPVISVTPQPNGIDVYVNILNTVNYGDLSKLITCWNNNTTVAVTNNPNDVTDTGIKQFDSTNATHIDANSMATENSAYTFAVFSCDDEVDNPTANAGAISSNAVTIKRPDVSSAVLYTDSACTSALGVGSDNVSIGQELYLKVIGTGGDFVGKCGAVLVNWDSGASDADDKYNRYEFTSSDTTSTNQVTIKHQFSKEGGFAVKVQVEDPRGFRSDKTAITGNAVDVDATAPIAVIKCSKTKVLNAKFADQDSAVMLTGSGSYAIGSNRKIKRYEWSYDAEKSISDGAHTTVVTAYATDNNNAVFDKSSSKVALADFDYSLNLSGTTVKVYGLVSKAADGSNVVDTADTFSHYEYGVASLNPHNGASYAGKYGNSSSEFFKTVEIIVGTAVDADDAQSRYTLAATTKLDSGTDLDEGSGIDASVVNFTVDDGTKFTVGDEIQIENEIMLVTNISTNELYIHRGWAHTTAAIHGDGLDIYITNKKINTNLRFKDNDALGSSKQDMGEFGGHTHFKADDSSGCTFTESSNLITLVNINRSSTGTTGYHTNDTDVDWFRIGFRIGDEIQVGGTVNNGTDAAPTTKTILDIEDTAGGAVRYDKATVDAVSTNETVQASIIKSDSFLKPISVAIYDGTNVGELTNITLHVYDDSSFYGATSTASIDIVTVEPHNLDLNDIVGVAINSYNITRAGGVTSEMPLGSRRYPVGNTRTSLGLPQLTMEVRVLTQEGYRQIYNLIEGDNYDYVFFDTDKVDTSTAYRQLKLQFISGSIQKNPEFAGQYTASLTFAMLGEEVE